MNDIFKKCNVASVINLSILENPINIKAKKITEF